MFRIFVLFRRVPPSNHPANKLAGADLPGFGNEPMNLRIPLKETNGDVGGPPLIPC